MKEKLRGIGKYNETNPFDFTDIPKYEIIDIKQFLNVGENNVVSYENERILDIIVDASKDRNPFQLGGVIKINGEETSQTNGFFKDVEQLTKSNEKMIDK